MFPIASNQGVSLTLAQGCRYAIILRLKLEAQNPGKGANDLQWTDINGSFHGCCVCKSPSLVAEKRYDSGKKRELSINIIILTGLISDGGQQKRDYLTI